ncbi:MAG: Maf family protein [Oscillospiraceae bacterium]
MKKTLILASASPRRCEILKNVGIPFTVKVSDIDETLPYEMPAQIAVEYLASLKNDAIKLADDEIIVSADTVVAVDNKILGKPIDKADAFNMLKSLSNRTHSVYTGVKIRAKEKSSIFSVKTDVIFFDLTDEEIFKYIETNEPLDKAGSYGIQGKGAFFVKEIHGDYLNVVGLPLSRLCRELKTFEGFTIE